MGASKSKEKAPMPHSVIPDESAIAISTTSLYTRIGGHATLEAAVDIFNMSVRADIDLKPFFEGISMQHQSSLQVKFLTYAFDGSADYSGQDMFTAHASLIRDSGLNLSHFYKVKPSLVEEVGRKILLMNPIFDPKRFDANCKVFGLQCTISSVMRPVFDPVENGTAAAKTETAVAAKAPEPKEPLFTRIGGTPAVQATVDAFYKKVLADPLLAPFFKDVDMTRQRDMQVKFVSMAFGSGAQYAATNMFKVHEKMIREQGLGLEHFDAVAGHLVASMKQLGVPQALIDEATVVVLTLRPVFDPVENGTAAAKTETAVAAKAPEPKEPLFTRIGGTPAVQATVDAFYKKVLADPLLAPFFKDVDMTRQRDMQVKFVSMAFGSGAQYAATNMFKIHEKMIREQGLGLEHFDAVAGHLVASMKQLGVPQALIDEATVVVLTLRLVFDPVENSTAAAVAKTETAVAAKAPELKEPLFTRIGGTPAVQATVDAFYKKVLADPLLAPFFKDVDMTRQRDMQVKFVSMAFGSGAQYAATNMFKVHEKMIREQGLCLEHFDAVAGHLVASMKQLGVPQALIDEATVVVLTLRPVFDPVENGTAAAKTETAVAAKAPEPKEPLLTRIGGTPAVQATVDAFYNKVLADPLLAPFFKDVDMTRQRDMQVKFVSMAFGSGAQYAATNMFKVHEKMIREQGLGLEHFDAVAGHLVASMKQLGVPQALIDEATVVVLTLRPVFDPVENGTAAAKTETAVAAKAPEPKEPLFTRIGGTPAVQATVDAFYKKVLADPLLAPFFKDVDMTRQRDMQVKFVSMAFGSGAQYAATNMFKVHEKMIREQGLCLEHFDAVAGHLVASMKQLGVPQALIDEATVVVLTLRPVFDPVENGTAAAKTETAVAAKAPEPKEPLLTRIGGTPAVQATVDAFYNKVLADPLLAPFFKDVDMTRQRDMQVKFVSMAFGSGAQYAATNMFKVHEKMIREQGLGLEHFDAVAGHLVASMKQLGVPQALIDEATVVVLTLRPVFDPVENGTAAAKTETAVAAKAPEPKEPLFTRIGGTPAVQATVDAFYKKVLADPLLAPFFKDVDMTRQRDMQVKFVSMAFGSGAQYAATNMFKVHEKMIREQGLGLEHFDAVAGHLVASMKQLGVPQALIDEATVVVLTLRPVFDPVENGTAAAKTETAVAAKAPEPKEPLFTRIGGTPAVQATVDAFYKKVLADPLLAPFFKDVDMTRQRDMQVKFVSMAFGSGAQYAATNMFKVHEKMIREQGLGLEHFDAVAGHLVASMKQLGVPQALIDEATVVVLTLRPVFDPVENGTAAAKTETAVAAKAPEPKEPLFTRIGGTPAVQATVDAFYKKVLADPLLAPFFKDVDMTRQRDMQVKFVSMAFGSGAQYAATNMFKIHEKMIREQGLGLEHFDAVAGHLVASMKQLGVPQALIDEATVVVLTLRPVFDPVENSTAAAVAKTETAVAAKAPELKEPLFTRIGGTPAVQATVDAFYKKVLADPLLAPFFKDVDMTRQRDMQVKFVSMAFGSGAQYAATNMFKVHEKMIREQGLGLEHFDAVAGHLVASMKQLGVPQALIDEATVVVLTLRPVFDPVENGTAAAKTETAVAAKAPEPKEPLFTRIGGTPAVQATVDAFYKKVLADPVLAPFFKDVDMTRQRDMQVKFVSMAFGSGAQYAATNMFKIHEKMIREQGLGLEHFDAVAGHLVASMKQLGVPQALIDEATAVAAKAPELKEPLFTRIGGTPAVQATVDAFYKKVLADPLLAPFFKDVDMTRQRDMQVKFVSMAFGSGAQYAATNMFKVHEKMIREQGLGLEHFDAVAGHLVASMKQLGVPQALIDEATVVVLTLRPVFDPVENGTAAAKTETAVAAKAPEPKEPLFTRIGGTPAVQATVDAFYKKVLADPVLAPFFKDVDMTRQRDMQVKFVSMAFGSGAQYAATNMFKVHEKMIREQGLGLEHFDAVAGHLVASMKQLGVPQALIDEATVVVLTLRPVFDPVENGTAAAKTETAVAAKAPEPKEPLFTRIGGTPAVQATVDAFYKKVLADPLLAPFFKDVDMTRQRDMQVKFMSMAFGSGAQYAATNMFKVHEKMIREQGLGLEHFDAVAGHLVASMKQLGVPQALIDEATVVVLTLRPVFDPVENGTAAAKTETAVAAKAPEPKEPLFTRIGGTPAVQATVDAFYKKVLADPLLAPFFKDVDMTRQRDMQVKFMSMAFGSGAQYAATNMFKVHEKMIREQGLGLEHFDAVAGHLVASMKQLGVPQALIDEATVVVLTLRPVFDPVENGTAAAKTETAVAAKAPEPKEPLFTRIGGTPAVQATVDAFYKKVLADPLLAPFFKDVDMTRQRDMQVKFVSMAFGSGAQYAATNMFKVHEKMIREQGLCLEHFDAVAGHLVASMKQLGVPQALIDEATVVVLTLRPVFDPVENGTAAAKTETAVAAKAPELKEPLFTRIGGTPAVQATVDAFYKKVLADPLLAPFFKDVDMTRQRDMQVKFVSMAFGSGAQYAATNMFKVHEKMIREQGLGLEHFDAVAGHLVASMKQLGVPQALIDEATVVVLTLRPVFTFVENGTAAA
eukprot:gene28922-biopygen32804